MRMMSFIYGESINVNLFHPEWLIRWKIKTFIRNSSSVARGLMIDLGCGTKPYKIFFNSHINSYIGIDHPIASKMVENPDNVKPEIYSDASQLPLRRNIADTVLIAETLEHLHRPSEVLSEVSRITNSGGILILTVPFFYPIHGEPNDFFRYTKWGLESILKQNRFEVIKIIEFGNFWVTQVILINNFLCHEVLGNNPIRKCARIILTPLWLVFVLITNLFGWIAASNIQPDHFISGIFVVAKKND